MDSFKHRPKNSCNHMKWLYEKGGSSEPAIRNHDSLIKVHPDCEWLKAHAPC